MTTTRAAINTAAAATIRAIVPPVINGIMNAATKGVYSRACTHPARHRPHGRIEPASIDPRSPTVAGRPRSVSTDPPAAAPQPTGTPCTNLAAMRAVVQRVTSASVSVAGTVVGSIDSPGLLVLVGVTHSDTPAVAEALSDKVWNLRILHDERSCAQTGAPLLVVSQFTLYADTRKGRRPSWNAAAPGPVSEPLVDAFVAALRRRGAEVASGRFGAMMAVASVNDGPMTVLLEL